MDVSKRRRLSRPYAYVFEPSVSTKHDAAIRICGTHLIETEVRKRTDPGIKAVGGKIQSLTSNRVEICRSVLCKLPEGLPESFEGRRSCIVLGCVKQRADLAFARQDALKQVPRSWAKANAGKSNHLCFYAFTIGCDFRGCQQANRCVDIRTQSCVAQQKKKDRHRCGWKCDVAKGLPSQSSHLCNECGRGQSSERVWGNHDLGERAMPRHVGHAAK